MGVNFGLVSYFCDETQQTVMHPRTSHVDLYHALIDADMERAGEALFAAIDEGDSVAALCDGPIAHALEEVGKQWEHGAEGILNEHRSTIVCIQLLVQFRMRLPPGRGHPLAIGGTPAGDSYQLASMMAAMIFKSEGWDDINLGPNVTVEAYVSAIRAYQPAAVWISFNVEEPAACFVREWKPVLEAAEQAGITIFVGGRAFPAGAEAASRCLRYLPNMESLAQEVREFSAPKPASP